MTWKYVSLKPCGNLHGLCLPITGNAIDSGILQAMKLDEFTKTTDLPLDVAVRLGQQIEDWRAGQESDLELSRAAAVRRRGYK